MHIVIHNRRNNLLFAATSRTELGSRLAYVLNCDPEHVLYKTVGFTVKNKKLGAL